MDALKLMAESCMKKDLPVVNIGDTVRVGVKIKEGDRERIQAFEGTVIAKKHGGIAETFTVRRVAHGVGIERVFPIHSPAVASVEVIRSGKVRRAKLCDGKEELVKSSFFVFIRKMSIQVSGFTVE